MCGICGITGSNLTDKHITALSPMIAALEHRGPDDSGEKHFGNALLGFRRLSIIDLNGSHQPLANEDSSVWAVCNGEIYNYRELRRNLSALGHVFRTDGDAETVVHAYEEWGDKFLQHLRGMFALAVWDENNSRMLIARDRIGIKPLYYSLSDERLLFSSELASIHASRLASREIDRTALDLYLSLMYIPSPYTIFKDVRKLPPAHCLTYDGSSVEIKKYWAPPDKKRVISEKEAIDELTALLSESVNLHMQSDVPVGFFLSGGLDSSALTALAVKAGIKPSTFSIGFSSSGYNELPFANRVAEAFKTDHHTFDVEADASSILPSLIKSFGEPFADSSAIPTSYICRAASEKVKVVIGGDGGDELFAGYDWTRRYTFIERYLKMPSSVRSILKSAIGTDQNKPGVRAKLARFIADTESTPLKGYIRRMSCFTRETLSALYTDDMNESLSATSVENIMSPWFKGAPLDAMNLTDFGIYLPEDDLVKVDRMTMLHSIEGRVPLLDHKLVEFALSLPMSLKINNTTTKYIFKKSVRHLLPKEIMRQRKQGFAVPISKWMRNDLADAAKDLLLSDRAAARNIFKPQQVERLINEHTAGSSDHGHKLWSLLVLEVWFRLFIDQISPDSQSPDLNAMR